MKILLMVPLPSLLREPPGFPDLGIAYLARVVLDRGHDVRVLDWANTGMDVPKLRTYLREERPEVVGIKFFTKDMHGALATARVVREELPDAKLLVGGPHPSAEEPRTLLEDFPLADFAIRGEGEAGLGLLLDRFGENGAAAPLADVPGLVYRDNGTIRHNAPSFAGVPDSFGIPPWELFEPKRYRFCYVGTKGNPGFMAPIVVSRGCPAHCNFCTAAMSNGSPVRHRSLDHVMAEIELLHGRYGVRQLMITDANFTYDRGFIVSLCEEILRRGIDISFNCPTGTRLSALDKETLPLLKRAGCHFIGLGIESASPRIRKAIKKGVDLMEIREKVNLINKHGIGVPAYFMLGFPDESREEMDDTIGFAFSERFFYRAFEAAYPLPGTELYGYLKSKFSVERVDWGAFDIYASQFPLSRLESAELTKLLRRLRLRVRLNPAHLLSAVKRRVAAYTLMD